ncbi:hypothetical protein [Heyndrickxia vini]|uniref:Uncharacterized protein n=1 Tax=Heyndrickxia vini TaxID=1476025 RepID=A0ABX7E5W9_9BACI|nr:hypothetical protein [Heyndrickxia vini]QQZ10700.1 hypothetical protein I5776_07330 [Heyndrickxia vini]
MVNQKGNTLINVMIVTIVIMTISLSIVAATINGAKRTSVRETDVTITYDGIKIIDDIVANLSLELSSNQTFKIDQLNPQLFTSQLGKLLSGIVEKHKDKSLSCINVLNVTGKTSSYLLNDHPSCIENTKNLSTFNIDEKTTLTRVIYLIAKVETPDKAKGYITRTITKRIILSPNPSFLKYVVGTRGKLVLNGSPTIIGNLYANDLMIDKNAYYQLSNSENYQLSAPTPLPDIKGDIYSNSTRFLKRLVKENFYNGNVPELKNDSQFADIDFNDAYQTQEEAILKGNGKRLITPNGDELSTIKNQIIHTFGLSMTNPSMKDESYSEDNPPPYHLKLIDKDMAEPKEFSENLVISNTNKDVTINDLTVNGDLFVLANKKMTFNNIHASGNIYLIGSKGNITINGGIKSNSNIIIDNAMQLKISGDIMSSGQQLMTNSGSFEADNRIIAGNSFSFKNYGSATFSEDLLIGDKLEIDNSGALEIARDLISGDNISVKSEKNSRITGNIYASGNLLIKSINSSLLLTGDMLSNGNLNIIGDSTDHDKEDDEAIFDSVIYARGRATISNINILGADNNEKELILLCGGKLTITRMNEFNNYQNDDETKGKNGVPTEEENIKPLQAFFYTEQNAELYGVGSLFYIKGGLFAKGNTPNPEDSQLEINSVRGKVTKIDNVKNMNATIQQGKFSRFIVDYDKDVLLKRIEALPKVETITVYPDNLIVR